MNDDKIMVKMDPEYQAKASKLAKELDDCENEMKRIRDAGQDDVPYLVNVVKPKLEEYTDLILNHAKGKFLYYINGLLEIINAVFKRHDVSVSGCIWMLDRNHRDVSKSERNCMDWLPNVEEIAGKERFNIPLEAPICGSVLFL